MVWGLGFRRLGTPGGSLHTRMRSLGFRDVGIWIKGTSHGAKVGGLGAGRAQRAFRAWGSGFLPWSTGSLVFCATLGAARGSALSTWLCPPPFSPRSVPVKPFLARRLGFRQVRWQSNHVTGTWGHGAHNFHEKRVLVSRLCLGEWDPPSFLCAGLEY